MKKWSTALLPLGILLVLAVLTTWLRYATELPDSVRDGKNRHDPDVIINDARGHKLDASGRLQYTIVAEEIRHFPDDETTELRQPRLVYLHAQQPPVTIRAEHAVGNKPAERVDLHEQVEVRRAASGKNAELVATMSELTVLTDEQKAFTKSQVLITQGNSWVQGVGLQIDNKLQTYLLESEVTGQIESSFARKKKPKT